MNSAFSSAQPVALSALVTEVGVGARSWALLLDLELRFELGFSLWPASAVVLAVPLAALCNLLMRFVAKHLKRSIEAA